MLTRFHKGTQCILTWSSPRFYGCPGNIVGKDSNFIDILRQARFWYKFFQSLFRQKLWWSWFSGFPFWQEWVPGIIRLLIFILEGVKFSIFFRRLFRWFETRHFCWFWGYLQGRGEGSHSFRLRQNNCRWVFRATKSSFWGFSSFAVRYTPSWTAFCSDRTRASHSCSSNRIFRSFWWWSIATFKLFRQVLFSVWSPPPLCYLSQSGS